MYACMYICMNYQFMHHYNYKDQAIPSTPTFGLKLVADINSPGLYLLNNSLVTDEGDIGSTIEMTATIIIKVFVIDEVMNYYIIKVGTYLFLIYIIVVYFVHEQEGLFDILSLEMFSCQAIEVSYAFANQHGVSSYSTVTHLTVPGSKLL